MPGTPAAAQSAETWFPTLIFALEPSSLIQVLKSAPNFVPAPSCAIFALAGSSFSMSVAGPFSHAFSALQAAVALPAAALPAADAAFGADDLHAVIVSAAAP